MVFSSNVFLLLFLPIVFIAARLIKNIRIQNILLIAASLFFYAYGEGLYVLLMLFTALITFGSVKLLTSESFTNGKRKIILSLSCGISLAILFIFKYARLFGADIALPIGVSFFTFQAISLSIDAYRRDNIQKDINIIDVLLYITFFPQLIAGPIVRFQDIAPSLRERTVTDDDNIEGFYRFCLGLGKKVIIANTVALVAAYQGWTGAIAYCLQIYFDFSGYSDMAIGMGRLFGFHFRENFNLPYVALTPKDFWRRWHISLSEWFRDYVYIPLGGNRKGTARTFLNVMIVFLCTGIWHGAGLTFLIWGVWNGLFVAAEGLIGNIRGRKISPTGIWAVFGSIFTLLFAILGFVIFKAENMKDALSNYKFMFSFRVNTAVFGLFDARMCIIFLLGLVLASPCGKFIRDIVDKSRKSCVIKAVSGIVLLIMSIAVLFAGSYNPFIYFRF